VALPDNGAVWPPEPHKAAYRMFAEYDAWYSGDIDALEQTYSYAMASGVWGQIKRMFWGAPRPNQQGERPTKMHVPVASEIARMSAQVVWGEMPAVKFADLDEDGDPPKGPQSMIEKANQRLAELIDDSAHTALLEAAELGSALTGAYLRICWDHSVSDTPFLVPMAPDQAVPTFRYGRLVSVVFWQELPKLDGDPGHWLLLESHEPGRIEYGLYASGNNGNIGTRVPLTEHPATAGLAATVDAESSVETGSELLTAAYFPNVKPNRANRKDPVMGNLGRSDLDGCIDLMDALDETYTSWMRDIRLGKARVLIDKGMLDVNAPGLGAQFNADREVFTNLKAGVGSLNGGGSAPIEQVQFAIRVQEHLSTAAHLLTRIFAAAGYSPSTFGETNNSFAPRSVTATEVDSREKLTLLTRDAKIRYAKPALQRLMAALLDVDAHVFHGPGRHGDLPEVEFPDALAPSMDALAQTVQLLRAAEAASTETMVEMVHPDWNAQMVKEEVARIQSEKASAFPALPDPTGMTGADLGPAADPTAPAGDAAAAADPGRGGHPGGGAGAQ
jgi:hypothetical protein